MTTNVRSDGLRYWCLVDKHRIIAARCWEQSSLETVVIGERCLSRAGVDGHGFARNASADTSACR